MLARSDSEESGAGPKVEGAVHDPGVSNFVPKIRVLGSLIAVLGFLKLSTNKCFQLHDTSGAFGDFGRSALGFLH